MIYELKITLKDVGAPVWRLIQIDSSATFYDLHRVLQVVFDWDNYHLHGFLVKRSKGEQIEDIEIKPGREDDPDEYPNKMETYNEKEQTLSDWFKLSKDKISYVYDFGDNWDHEILFMKKLKAEEEVKYPRCIDADNRAPEEDSRGEVLMGGVDLKFNYSNESIEEINEELRFQLPNLISVVVEDSADDWEKVLAKAKWFHKLKPWERLDDANILAVEDPVTGEKLFCSVLGAAGEAFGLAVYIGETGYLNLYDILNNRESSLEAMMNQRCLLLSFEDKTDLDKADYNHIRTYSIPFRGRKSWPQFRSYKPGFYPWMMTNEEARLMKLALNQIIAIYEEAEIELEMPDMVLEKKVLARIPKKDKDEIVYQTQILDLAGYPEEKEVSLALSELDLKRIRKLKVIKGLTIEFSMDHVIMPTKENPNKRAVLPLLVIAADHDEGLVMYENLQQEHYDVYFPQMQLVKAFQTLKGIPEKVIMNKRSAQLLKPVIDKLALHVEINEHLPVVQEVLEELNEQMEIN